MDTLLTEQLEAPAKPRELLPSEPVSTEQVPKARPTDLPAFDPAAFSAEAFDVNPAPTGSQP